MPEQTNLFLPWRESGDGYTIVDADGIRVASVPQADARAYIVEAANAYPRLRAQLDKALGACRALIECESERIERSTPDFEEADHLPEDYVGVPPEPDAYLRAVALARAALEMAGEERDCRG